MEWKCFTCEHLNDLNRDDCEVCGAFRNLYAEESYIHKEAKRVLENQIRALKNNNSKLKNEKIEFETRINELSNKIKKEKVKKFTLLNEINELNHEILGLRDIIKLNNTLVAEIKEKSAIISVNEKRITKLQFEIKYQESIIINRESKVGQLITMQKKAGIFLIWFLIHLVIFLVQRNVVENPQEKFWPLGDYSAIQFYDFTEFIFYILMPLITLIIIHKFKRIKPSKFKANKLKFYTSLIAGIFLFLISVLFFYLYYNNLQKIEYSDEINYETFAQFQQTNVILILISLLIRILISIWILVQTKNLNKFVWSWGVVTFMFPALSLIYLSLKKIWYSAE